MPETEKQINYNVSVRTKKSRAPQCHRALWWKSGRHTPARRLLLRAGNKVDPSGDKRRQKSRSLWKENSGTRGNEDIEGETRAGSLPLQGVVFQLWRWGGGTRKGGRTESVTHKANLDFFLGEAGKWSVWNSKELKSVTLKPWGEQKKMQRKGAEPPW